MSEGVAEVSVKVKSGFWVGHDGVRVQKSGASFVSSGY
jgi:hypothetical protein